MLKELAVFLNALTEGEWEEIPKAAEALGKHPRGGARALANVRPSQPVEVCLARVNGRVVGALLLRRRWVAEAFASNCNQDVQQTEQWSRMSNVAVNDWLAQLNRNLGSWLLHQLEILPDEFDLHLEQGEGILDILESASPEEVDAWMWVPSVVRAFQQARNGSIDRRNQARAILQSWTKAKRGRPRERLEDRADVVLARRVEQIERSLRAGFEFCRAERRKRRIHRAGELPMVDSDIRTALIQQHACSETEADAILSGIRTLQDAALHVIAHEEAERAGQVYQWRVPRGLRSRLSRGRKLLGRSDR